MHDLNGRRLQQDVGDARVAVADHDQVNAVRPEPKSRVPGKQGAALTWRRRG